MLPTIAREAEVRTLVGEVLRHGVSSDNVTLVALIIARPALRVLLTFFKSLMPTDALACAYSRR